MLPILISLIPAPGQEHQAMTINASCVLAARPTAYQDADGDHEATHLKFLEGDHIATYVSHEAYSSFLIRYERVVAEMGAEIIARGMIVAANAGFVKR